MRTKKIILKLKNGLHLRPAGNFVQTANKFSSKVRIRKGDIEVNGKSLLELITIGAVLNTELNIITEGEDEDIAIEELASVLLSYES